ncbi:MAG TPA: helix-turn-helix transcriptional regulator [Candidatus Limnocylindria bacterium]|jgi:AraC-like DNA-binding protein|nr:helix-turn-helix transcriptional regulator [Candidatus Limnocylindria bacterium]
MASLLGISLRQVQRHFRSACESTVHDFLFELRMKDAATLLASTLRIYEVSSLLGYHSTSHFCRDFKRYFQQSPLKYKRNVKEPMSGEYFLAQYAELLQDWQTPTSRAGKKMLERVPIAKSRKADGTLSPGMATVAERAA